MNTERIGVSWIVNTIINGWVIMIISGMSMDMGCQLVTRVR